jgi:hypothetical protein
MIFRKHREPDFTDSRPKYAPLADGDKVWAPGQTAHIRDLIAGGRMIRMVLPAGTPLVPRTLR